MVIVLLPLIFVAATSSSKTNRKEVLTMASRALQIDPDQGGRRSVTRKPSQEEIAALAHRFWLERGCPIGSDLEDWFRAERELAKPAVEEEAFDIPAETVIVTVEQASSSVLRFPVRSELSQPAQHGLLRRSVNWGR